MGNNRLIATFTSMHVMEVLPATHSRTFQIGRRCDMLCRQYGRRPMSPPQEMTKPMYPCPLYNRAPAYDRHAIEVKLGEQVADLAAKVLPIRGRHQMEAEARAARCPSSARASQASPDLSAWGTTPSSMSITRMEPDMKVFKLLPSPPRNIFRKLTHFACNSPEKHRIAENFCGQTRLGPPPSLARGGTM